MLAIQMRRRHDSRANESSGERRRGKFESSVQLAISSARALDPRREPVKADEFGGGGRGRKKGGGRSKRKKEGRRVEEAERPGLPSLGLVSPGEDATNWRGQSSTKKGKKPSRGGTGGEGSKFVGSRKNQVWKSEAFETGPRSNNGSRKNPGSARRKEKKKKISA